MFFDRNEIHIQALVVFSNGTLIIFNPHLGKNIFKIYIQKIKRKPEQQSKNKYRKNLVPRTYRFRFFSNFSESHIDKNNIFQDAPIICLVFFEAFW